MNKDRKKRAIILIFGKELNVLLGTITENNSKIIKRKLVDPDDQVARESVSIFNITRVDMAKNRQSFNWLIRTVQDLGWEIKNATETITVK